MYVHGSEVYHINNNVEICHSPIPDFACHANRIMEFLHYDDNPIGIG